MKKHLILLFILLVYAFSAFSQGKYFTRTGRIHFFSETPVENIEAVNNQTSSIFDTDNGNLVLSVQMVGFEFEKALMLMQRHLATLLSPIRPAQLQNLLHSIRLV